jgi:hypothetical protein
LVLTDIVVMVLPKNGNVKGSVYSIYPLSSDRVACMVSGAKSLLSPICHCEAAWVTSPAVSSKGVEVSVGVRPVVAMSAGKRFEGVLTVERSPFKYTL